MQSGPCKFTRWEPHPTSLGLDPLFQGMNQDQWEIS